LVGALRAAATSQKACLDIRAQPQSILAGAIGAALWGAFRHRRLQDRRAALAPPTPSAGVAAAGDTGAAGQAGTGA
jgi:hypothetical protein